MFLGRLNRWPPTTVANKMRPFGGFERFLGENCERFWWFWTFLVVLKAFWSMHTLNILTKSCEHFWWFWTFFEACIPVSVLKCSCRELWTFQVVLNVFWSMHTLFCLEICLRRVVSVFGGFKRFLKHTYVFLYWFCGRMMQPIHFCIYTESQFGDS